MRSRILQLMNNQQTWNRYLMISGEKLLDTRQSLRICMSIKQSMLNTRGMKVSLGRGWVTTLFTSFIGFKKWQGLKENVCHGRKRLNTI